MEYWLDFSNFPVIVDYYNPAFFNWAVFFTSYQAQNTWRIVPWLGYVVNNHGDGKSPN